MHSLHFVNCLCTLTGTRMEGVQMTSATSFAGGKPVFGVAYLDNEVYVLRRRTPDIEVYEVSAYKLTSRLPVSNLRNPLDVAACSQTKRVYVVDGLDPSGKVFGVETRPTSENAASSSSRSSRSSGSGCLSWSVGEMAMNVSVTSTATVVVTCGKVAQLREFTGDGQLIRQISMNADLVSAQHAVQLTSPDLFVVAHGWMDDALHRVCVVDARDPDTPPTDVYGQQRGSARSNLLHNPSHVSVDSRRQCVFVVDMGNRRVVALDSSLCQLADVPVVVDKKRLPSRICLDEERCLLYVACNEWKDVFWTSGTVNVFSVNYKQ